MLNSKDQREDFNSINYFKLCKIKIYFELATVNNSNTFLTMFSSYRIHNYLRSYAQF